MPLPIEPPMCDLAGTGPDGFLMGDNSGRGDERPVHRVVVASFSIAIWPVTNGQYEAFLQATDHAPPPGWGKPPFDHPDAPVCAVSWDEARAHADWLTQRTGQHFHLPTEAQREYAARGGREQLAYPWGDDPLPLEGPYQRGLDGPLVGGPVPVFTPQRPPDAPVAGPNGFGLYHMADNVHEWGSDYYDRQYYGQSPAQDPSGPTRTDRRAARGGSWRHDIKYCRCAARSSLGPTKQFADFGFRVAASEGFEYVV